MADPFIQRTLGGIASAKVKNRRPGISCRDRDRQRFIAIAQQHDSVVLLLQEQGCKRCQRRRLVVGEKGLTLWEGHSPTQFARDFKKWPKEAKYRLINSLAQCSVHRSFFTGASLPARAFETEYTAFMSHAFVRMNDAGWKPVPGATKYYIYRDDYTSNIYGTQCFKGVGSAVTTYEDTSVINGYIYSYDVYAGRGKWMNGCCVTDEIRAELS